MGTSSLVWKMDLPIPYGGPLQTSLECLCLHKRRNEQNYKRVMERIFFETKVTPECPVTVKVFDDHMEFYPLSARRVPLTKLCYKDVLYVQPSRNERKVLIVAIPAQDNSGGIWIVAMRFLPVGPVKPCVKKPELIVCPPLNCTEIEICMPILVLPPQKANIFRHKPVKKEMITSITEIIKRPLVVQPVYRVTYFICTPSSTKKRRRRDWPSGNIKVTEIPIGRCVHEPSIKSNFRTIYAVVPENMNIRSVQKYIENDPLLTFGDNEEFCVVIEEPTNEKCRRKKRIIKKHVRKSSQNSFLNYSNSSSESDNESNDSYLSRRNINSKPKYCLHSKSRRQTSKNSFLDITVLHKKGRSPSKCVQDSCWNKIFTIEDGYLQKTYPSFRRIPEKVMEISILPDEDPPKNKPKRLQDNLQIRITPLDNKRSTRPAIRYVNPSPLAFNYTCSPIMNDKTNGMKLSRHGSFNLKFVSSQEDCVFSSLSDESSASIALSCTKLKKRKTSGRKETIHRKTTQVMNDFIIRNEMETDYMFLQEKTPKYRQFHRAKPSKRRYDSNGRVKINDVLLEYDPFSKLNSPTSKTEEKIVITKEDISSESDSLSTISSTISDKFAKTSTELSQTNKFYEKKDLHKRNKLSFSSNSSALSDNVCEKCYLAKNDRPRRHSMGTVDNVAEIDKSFSNVDFEVTPLENIDKIEEKKNKSSPRSKYIDSTNPKLAPIPSVRNFNRIIISQNNRRRFNSSPSTTLAKSSDGHIGNEI